MIRFETLDPQKHDRNSFDCGVNSLNTYLKRYANQDQKRQLTKVYVLSDNKQIIGFYSLSAHSISRKFLPNDLKVSSYGDVPFLLLGRLAVDKLFQKKGYGDALIIHSFKSTIAAAKYIGIIGLVVDAKDEKAISFYEGFGFLKLKDTSNRLVLSFDEISTWLK